MKDEKTIYQSRKNSKIAQNRKSKKWRFPMIGMIIILSLFIVVGILYFQSHFFITAKANGINIGLLNVKEAKNKLDELNKDKNIIVKADGKEETIVLPEKYEITENFLKENIEKHAITLPINADYQAELKNKLEQLSFAGGTESQDAKIEMVNGTYQIIPETLGTVVDKEALMNKIMTDVEANTGKYNYDVTNFYKKPSVTKESKELQNKLTALTQKQNKTITLTINGQQLMLTKDDIQSFLDENGEVNSDKVYAWVQQTNQNYGTIYQPIVFTNVHGVTKKYKNNGRYGWSINLSKTTDLIIEALNNEQSTTTIEVPIDGDANASSTVNKDYVEVDLNDQKMYFFKNGVKVVETAVITGRYNKGTATVPGFHTILYKDTNTKLEGSMLDGSKYSVPVKYWMPLLSYGGVVTQIGIHDADYKAEYFGNKEAYKTNFGSNGCINTPGAAVAEIFNGAYAGMPVIIYGTIYDDAPGQFDKPVDYGEAV